MNELLMQLLGFGGGGTGNYNQFGAPSGGYGGPGYLGPPVQQPRTGLPIEPVWSGGKPVTAPPGGWTPDNWANSPYYNPSNTGGYGGGGTTLGGMPAGDNKGGPQAGSNTPLQTTPPPTVGSAGWIGTHPDYKTNFPGGNAPTVGSAGWMSTHPDYKKPI